MSSNVTIAVDLAKNVFQLTVSNGAGRVTEHRRFTRPSSSASGTTGCPAAWSWRRARAPTSGARQLTGLGFDVVLLPTHYVRPYVRRNKTDRTDCEALLEALRCSGVHPVSVKSEDQQAVAALHRVRSQWMSTRTARINGARALLREFGVTCPTGADRFLGELPRLLDEKKNQLPSGVRHALLALWEEVRALEERVCDVEGQLKRLCAEQPTLQALLQISGIGVLTSTALWAAIGSVHSFPSGRHLASWLGLTPRESSSGSRRRLGGISKQGDPYLRMLLHPRGTLGAASGAAARAGKQAAHPAPGVGGHEGAGAALQLGAVALANKLARVIWAVWHYERAFDGNHLPRAT